MTLVVCGSLLLTGCTGGGGSNLVAAPVSTGTNTSSTGTSGANAYVFDDEFSGSSLETTRWVAMNRPGDSSNSELQYYLPSNVALSNGLLNITSKVGSQSGYNYTSGMVQWKSFNFTYGTVEVRAKMAGGKGTWPAIWFLGYNCQQTNVNSADNIPPCNWSAPGSDEIDFVEILGSDHTHVNQQIHSGSNNGGCSASVSDVSQNWHIYTLIWAPGSLTWKIDGVTTCQVTSGVPSTPMFLLINTAMGGAGGSVDTSTLPQMMSVDYVRVTSP
jgi:beta-glucanase (GH16 family)